MNLADMLRNSPLRRQRNEGQGEYDRPESYYRNQGIDGQPLPSISDRLQSMGMDSSIKDRPMLIPVREDGEWTAPEWFHSMARGAMLPAQAALGGTVTPLDTAMATADFAGGGLLSSKAIPNAVPDGAVLGATAWHGSPHKFDEFDMSKIGTGEGAQAYGHGLYAAENPNVAKEYADELTRKIKVGENIIQGKDKTIGTTGIEDVDDYLIADRGDASLALSNMKKDRLEIANSSYPENAKSYDAGIEMLEGLVKRGEVQNTTAGNLYKLDIPDDQIAKMLDWNKPLSEQPTVMDFINKNYPKANKPFEKRYVSPANTLFDPEDSTAFEFLQSFGSGNRAKASEMLKDHGIPGIKYLDQGSRTGGQGTSNFVLFADDIAKILERNDQPIGDLAKGLDESLRMGRAKDMGFDVDKTWYRGTDKDYKRGKKDSFYSSDPEFAEQFTYGTGPIAPVYAKGKIFNANNQDEVSAVLAKMDELNAHAKANPYTDAVSYYPYARDVLEGGVARGDAHKIEQEIVQQALKELGYDGTKLMEGGVENLMMFNPKNIRSKFAKFDPRKKNSGNVLAGAGAGFLASQLMGQDPNERF
jgi:hypothetical protein